MKSLSRRAATSLLLLAPPLYFAAVSAYLMAYGSQNRAQKADAIVIFGAHVRRDGRASTVLRERTRHAFELWQSGFAPKIVCTGGIGTWPPAEAVVERELLRSWDVPDAAILIETTSTSTRENVRNAAALLPRGARVIGVSEPFHLWRCRRDGAHFGLRVFTSPETRGWSAMALRDRAHYLVREVLAVSRDLIFDLF